MADAELLLTVNGADVTGGVEQWRTVRLADALDQHPTVQFTLREPFGSVTGVRPYDDLRLLDLLTGQVHFEGVVAPGPVTSREVDPAWVETEVSGIGYQALFDTASLAQDVVVGQAADYLSCRSSASVIADLVAASFGDARVPVPVSWAGYSPYVSLSLDTTALTFTVPARTRLSQAISSVLAASWLVFAGGIGLDGGHPHIARLYPGRGLVIHAPDVAPLGAAGRQLTAADAGRPARVDVTVDGSDSASAQNFDWSDVSVVTSVPSWGAYGAISNGYVVFGPDGAHAAGTEPTGELLLWISGDGVPRTSYTVTTAPIADGFRPGQTVVFETARLGTVTGIVQGVQTTFSDGVFDTSAEAWPWFLDGGRSLDGTWTLDAAVSRVIPRRKRTSALVVVPTSVDTVPAGNARRSFARYLRHGTY